jgi:hypothetical protein
MATQKFSSPVRGIRAAGCGAAVFFFPAGLGKTGGEKNFEVFSRMPSDAVGKPLGCQSRMMD